MNLDNYITYLSELAMLHKEIGNGSEKHFFLGEMEEFFADLRSKVRFPALICEWSTFSLGGSDYNTQVFRDTAFSIVDRYEQGNTKKALEVMSHCEELGKQIIARMIDDQRKAPFGWRLEVESVQGEFIQNDSCHYAGCRFSFVVDEYGCINNKKNWLDEES